MYIWLTFLMTVVVATSSAFAQAEPDKPRWRDYVQTALDTLLEHGTDRYGEVHTPMLMSILDLRTLESPEFPELYDGLVRTEGRTHRRAEGGANLWNDQITLRTLYRMSALTGDDRYAQAADAYINVYFERAAKHDGLLIWGVHSFYSAYQDAGAGQRFRDDPRYPDPPIKIGEYVHEILVRHGEWEHLYRIDPNGCRKLVDALWQWHVVDKATGATNRHDDAGGIYEQVRGDYSYSSGTFITAFSAMYKLTGQRHYLDKARLLANWHWSNRGELTNLIPQSPSSARHAYNGRHMMTSETGPYVAQLLKAFELSGDHTFRDMAIAYTKSFDRFAWDESAGTYYAMLRLDGKPVTRRNQISSFEWNDWAPLGHVNVWRTTVFPFEFPVVSAQSAIYAWELSHVDPDQRDSQLLLIAERWARVIEDSLPPGPGRRPADVDLIKAMPNVEQTGGTYAENYGRAISFFVHLYRATRNEHYLHLAEGLANEAVDKVWDNGLFRGHPAKPYYDALDGVGLLLWALLDLDQPDEPLSGAF